MTKKSNKKKKKNESTTPKSKVTFIVLGVIFAIFLISVVIYTNYDNVYDRNATQFCFDDKEIFDQSDEDKINSKLKELQLDYKLTIYVATCGRYYDAFHEGHAEVLGTQFLHDKNISYDSNVFVIIINAVSQNNDYHFDLYKYGASASRIRQKEEDAIIWSTGADKILVSNNYISVDGILEVAELCGKAYRFVLPKQQPKTILAIALVISLIVTLIIILSIKKSYTRSRENNTYSFAENTKVNFNEKRDNYVRSVVTSVRISSDSGGGGGGHGGGGHSSGGGGGGGHCGGR